MGWYDEEREQLKALVLPSLKADAIQRGHPDTQELAAMLDSRLEASLTRFERAATAHHHRDIFLGGVLQSLTASVVFTLLIYLAAVLLAATKIDPFGPLRRQPVPAPSPSASP